MACLTGCGNCDGYETAVPLDNDEWFCTTALISKSTSASANGAHAIRRIFLNIHIWTVVANAKRRAGHEKDD